MDRTLAAFRPDCDPATGAAPDASAPTVILRFDSAEDADWRVAGVPAAARLCRELARAGCTRLAILIGGQRPPHSATMAEIARLAPGMAVETWWESRVPVRFSALPDQPLAIVSGRFLIDGDALGHWFRTGGSWFADGQPVAWLTTTRRWREPPARHGGFVGGQDDAVPLADAARLLIRQTAKPSDGIVSRWLNRPVSQRISALLLHIPGARPVHATMLTAAAALAMIACLLFGGAAGLIAGGVLFHIASVLDGVDGEMARATFRSSRVGAALDTGVDMATNLLFVGGVAANLWLDGRTGLAWTALGALGALGGGILLLGWLVRLNGQGPSFNLLKSRVSDRLAGRWSARIGRILVAATSRDFFALFFMVMFLLHLEAVAVPMFAVSAALWFVVVAAAVPVHLMRRWNGSAERCACPMGDRAE